ncbi:MAG TPA: hypothetical protein VF681_01710 [Abditibacteriaceae bacterium]|jgi:hypothetical protein
MKNRSFPALLDSIVLALLLLAMCSQFDLAMLGRDTYATEKFATKRLAIALPDIALLLAFTWFCLRTTMLRAWGRVWLPPFACFALVFCLILSAIHSPTVVEAVSSALSEASGPKAMIKALLAKEGKEAIAETIQWTAYFLFAPLVFVNLLRDVRDANGPTISRLKLASHVFGGAVLLNILWAAKQRFLDGSAAPQGFFNSPNAYGAFLVLALPILLAQGIATWRGKPALPIAFACLGGTLLTVSSVWAGAGIILGLVFAGSWQGMRPRATILLIACLPFLLLWDTPSRLQKLRIESARVASSFQPVKKQFREWFIVSGASVPREKVFATGVGAGNYQFNSGSYYKSLPSPAQEKLPPDSNNLVTVQFVAIGALGLAALAWAWSWFWGCAWRARRLDNWLAAGALASLTAFAVVNIFHAAIVRGTGVALAFIFALAVISQYGEHEFQREVEPEAQQNA